MLECNHGYEAVASFSVENARDVRLMPCSGKCQIIHWRQGHKEECQPPDICSSYSFVSTLKIEYDSTSSLLEPMELRSASCTEKDALMHETPIYEISRCEAPINYGVSSSNDRSNFTSEMDPITSTLDSVSSVLDNPGSKICQMDFSSSVDANSCLDYFWSSRSYENDLHNSMSITHNNSTSGNPIIDLHILKGASKNPLNASRKICEMDTSRSSTFIHNGPSNLSTLDEACPRRCAYDIPNSTFSSYDLDDDNKSVSFSSRDNSSYLDRASKFYNVMPTEIDSVVSLPELRSSRGSLSTSTIRRSIGYAIRYFSRHKARASSHTNSNHLTGSNNAVSSSTTSSVGFSQTPVLDLKGL